MEKTILETKDKRSRLKARLTTLSKLITGANKTRNSKQLDELNTVYSELLTTHYLYCELVESDDGFSVHETVGNLNLKQYLEAIEYTYNNATESYAASLSEDVKRALKKVKNTFF